MQLARYADALRTVWLALTASDTVVGLAFRLNGTCQVDEVLAAMLAIVGITHLARQYTLVLAFVVMNEDGRDVDAVRTGHAVLAVVAGNVLQS